MFRYPIALIISVIFLACHSTPEINQKKGFLKTKGQTFIDSNGRQVILSGINLISKNPKEDYIPAPGREIFKQFSNWGFNCIRLGIIWDGLEPEPGKYNEKYFEELDKRIKWAGENGLYIFLDMHQDLYGSKFSDGAPAWATIDEGKPHQQGAIWSDSYLISQAVQTAFDNFWKNAPAPDGTGLQDHYANLWKYIAHRYADNTTVIGYDIMNEPFMGSSAQTVMPLILGSYAKIIAEETGRAPASVEELSAIWSNEESRLKALEQIATRDKYSKVIDAIYEVNADFEKNQLMPMYQKVANAIREVDNNHILFLNHSYFVNTGVSTAIEATKLRDGRPDPLVAYAAHGYDLVVDTKNVEKPSYERVEFIFDRIAQSSTRMNLPVLLGEWGALHDQSEQMVKTAKHLIKQIEKNGFSNTYWAFYDDIASYSYFKEAIIRPYPQEISGVLKSYDYDFDTGKFTMSWEEDTQIQSPTMIYLPRLSAVSDEIRISPESEKLEKVQMKNCEAGWLVIPPTGKGGLRTAIIQFVHEGKESYRISQRIYSAGKTNGFL